MSQINHISTPENYFNYKVHTLGKIKRTLLSARINQLYHKRRALVHLNLLKCGHTIISNTNQRFTVYHKLREFIFEYTALSPDINDIIMVSHPSMQEQWDEFAEETDALEEETKIITHYLRTVFNKINCIEDLYRLVSSSLHEYLPVKLLDKGMLTDKEIEEIKKELEPMQDVVEQRILLNLIQK